MRYSTRAGRVRSPPLVLRGISSCGRCNNGLFCNFCVLVVQTHNCSARPEHVSFPISHALSSPAGFGWALIGCVLRRRLGRGKREWWFELIGRLTNLQCRRIFLWFLQPLFGGKKTRIKCSMLIGTVEIYITTPNVSQSNGIHCNYGKIGQVFDLERSKHFGTFFAIASHL